jgi:hypothetical protein
MRGHTELPKAIDFSFYGYTEGLCRADPQSLTKSPLTWPYHHVTIWSHNGVNDTHQKHL